jgi:hypothetical protein
MKKKKTVPSLELTEELLQGADLIPEYVDYLRSKVKRRDDGAYCCGTEIDGYYKCWDQTERLCKKKGLDFDTVLEKLNLYFRCESNIAHAFDLDAFRKETERRREKGRNI